jgi:hypothetical protein
MIIRGLLGASQTATRYPQVRVAVNLMSLS